MRKRRRLANKMTIMVCAVLIAVSAFFYAPLEVSASSSVVEFEEVGYSSSGSLNTYDRTYNPIKISSDIVDLFDGFSSSDLYKANISIDFTFSSSQLPAIRNVVLTYGSNKSLLFYSEMVIGMDLEKYNGVFSVSFSKDIFVSGNGFNPSRFYFECIGITFDNSVVAYDYNFNISAKVNSLVALTGAESETYQNGYNAGYSAGEQAGYGNGYSQGYTDGEASVDTDTIYDEAFQAGKDSVDTQSYYDAGYQAGYQVAYSEGYESGYDEGYQSVMDRIASWGADTSDYPLEISSGNTNAYFSVHVGSDIPFNYRDSDHWFSSSEYNPNHTYKYVINFSNIDEGLDSDILYDYWDIYLNIGGIEYNITPFKDMSVSVFIPGDRISTSYSLDWVLYNCANYVADDSNLAYLYVDYDFVIYDMGPSGDTQNHIANQTDQLTNGYDDSKGNQVNSDLSTGLNDYETAENSLFATATTGMKDFTFFDFESVPAMITGMSFIGSIMGSWFNQAGGASGVGIVLSILFSVILVAMVLGLYRWYQSRGGKN